MGFHIDPPPSPKVILVRLSEGLWATGFRPETLHFSGCASAKGD